MVSRFRQMAFRLISVQVISIVALITVSGGPVANACEGLGRGWDEVEAELSGWSRNMT